MKRILFFLILLTTGLHAGIKVESSAGVGIGNAVTGGGANRILHQDNSQNLSARSGFTISSSTYVVGVGTSTPTLSTLGNGFDIVGSNAGIRLRITEDQGWGFTEYLNESGVGKFIAGYRDVGEMYGVRPGTSLGGSTGWSMNTLGNVSLGANPYSVYSDLYELNIGTTRNATSGVVIANASTGASSDSRVFLSNNVESHGISFVQYGQNHTGAHAWADADSGGLVTESQNDSLFLATNGATPIHFITNNALRMFLSSTGDLNVTSGTIRSGQLMAIPVSTQTISAGNTVTADQCGGIKRITSSGSVTTNTTNTFTALDNTKQCVMTVINVGSNNITLDANTNFISVGGADVVLTGNDAVSVGWSGAFWYQLSPVAVN